MAVLVLAFSFPPNFDYMYIILWHIVDL